MEADWLDIEYKLQDAYDLLGEIKGMLPKGHKARLTTREAQDTVAASLEFIREDVEQACEKLDAE